MSSNVSDVLNRWNQAFIEERKRSYEYVGLRPIKKNQSYFLVLSPLALVGEIASNFSSYIAGLSNTPNHGFTVYPSNKHRPPKVNKPATNNTIENTFLKDNPNIDSDTLILTYQKIDERRQLQCHIYKPEHKVIILSLSNDQLEKQITDAIARNKKKLTAQEYNAVANELAKHGYILKSYGFFGKIEKWGEKTKIWGQPIFQKNEVNLFNAYLSWKDFFNDIKALVVKPITVFLLGIGHIIWAIWKLGCCVNSLVQRNPNALENFDTAVQSLLKFLLYSLMSYYCIIAIAQGLAIMTRMLMTIPSILDNIPGAFNACSQQGVPNAVGGELRRFAGGFCSMFSRSNQETPSVNDNANGNQPAPHGVAQNREELRAARLAALHARH